MLKLLLSQLLHSVPLSFLKSNAPRVVYERVFHFISFPFLNPFLSNFTPPPLPRKCFLETVTASTFCSHFNLIGSSFGKADHSLLLETLPFGFWDVTVSWFPSTPLAAPCQNPLLVSLCFLSS